MGDLHLAGPSARKLPRLDEQIPRHCKRVVEVALDFRKHILCPAPEQNRACLRFLALDEISEIFVADLADLEEAAPRSDVLFGELIRAIHDGCAATLRDSVVVRLADPTSSSVSSSVRFTMVAPQHFATRLLSVLRIRRITAMFAFSRKCCARSLTPFSVMTTSGLNLMISSQSFCTSSSSCISKASQ